MRYSPFCLFDLAEAVLRGSLGHEFMGILGLLVSAVKLSDMYTTASNCRRPLFAGLQHSTSARRFSLRVEEV